MADRVGIFDPKQINPRMEDNQDLDLERIKRVARGSGIFDATSDDCLVAHRVANENSINEQEYWTQIKEFFDN